METLTIEQAIGWLNDPIGKPISVDSILQLQKKIISKQSKLLKMTRLALEKIAARDIKGEYDFFTEIALTNTNPKTITVGEQYE